MKFIQILINFPGAEKPYVLGCVFNRIGWHDEAADADVVEIVIADSLKRNDGALDLFCSDGIHRRIGATLLATAVMEYQIVDVSAPGMPVQEMPATAELLDAT